MSNIPINDLSRQNAPLKIELSRAMERVRDSGWYVLGREVEAFESGFAAYLGTTHAVGVGNGTDALELALRALEIKPGDRVATVANAGMYATTAIRLVGAEPLYVDVDPESMNMAPAVLEAALTPEVKAVIVTHLYGRMANMDVLMAVATGSGIPVIEDCAQAHGAVRGGHRAGSLGAIGCFSFYPTKNLGALGDGGAVVTSDDALAQHLRRLRQYGWATKYTVATQGGRNSRLDELQAAVLRTKLPHLDAWNARRREIAARYSNGLAGTGLKVPDISGEDYVAHLYVVRTDRRDALRSHLRERGIGTDIHYPVPDHRQQVAREEGVHLLVTDQCAAEVLTLPCFPEMTDDEVEQVIRTTKAVLCDDQGVV